MIDSKKSIKLCFVASSGGHFEQLMMLRPLMDKYDSFVLTEKTKYDLKIKGKIYYVDQVNRKDSKFILNMLKNLVYSLKIYFKEKPDAVICTGVLATIPICLIAKLAGKKLIYIESFAKVTTATKTGKLMYMFADRFYVQWEQLLDVYPKALYLGSLY